MMRSLQSFAFNKSPNERPNQKWVCGRAAEGCACRAGPDRRGRCRGQAECAPRQDGSRWMCNRGAAAGGPCTEGPLPDGRCAHPVPPCQPVRSMRTKRGAAARWASAVAIGLVILTVYGAGGGGDWLSPGTLSAPHTQLAACSDCHEDFDGGPVAWVHGALAGSPDAADGDSALCLSCHDPGDAPLQPHGVPATRLAKTGGGADGAAGPVALEAAAAVFASPDTNPGGVACANCHREHQGRDNDLTAMGDRQCQACHDRKFSSLGDGHPEFDGWPHERRTRIAFDHVGHMRRHFPASEADQAPERCVDCHRPDDTGGVMQVNGFEQACADCHAGDSRGSNAASSTGIPVIAVPGLDVLSLREAGARIGQWPELSDRDLTPFMRTLFSADPQLADALERYRGLDPLDLREASPADIEAVERIAWATKALIHRLVTEGPAALRPGLGDALGDRADAAARRLLGGMSYDTVKRAQAEWFPDLAREVALHRAGRPVPPPEAESTTVAENAGTASPDGGEDILSADADAGDGGSGDDILGGSSDGGSGDDILGGSDDGGSDDDILGGSGDGGSDDDILGDSGDAGSDDILGGSGGDSGDDILSSDSGGDLLGDGDAGDPETDVAVPTAFAQPKIEEWSRFGGWYRDFFALLYRPGGHAEPFLREWLDLAGHAAGADRPGARALFEQLGKADAPGKCTKCHSVDADESGALRVNWRGRSPHPGRQEFTRFAHAPHFTLLTDDTGCVTCHALDRDAEFMASFDDRDPATYQSNFTPIDRSTCAGCHVEEQAGNACTQCHEYHVGQVASEATATRIDTMEAEMTSR